MSKCEWCGREIVKQEINGVSVDVKLQIIDLSHIREDKEHPDKITYHNKWMVCSFNSEGCGDVKSCYEKLNKQYERTDADIKAGKFWVVNIYGRRI